MAAFLSGCAAMHDGFEATGRMIGSPVSVADAAPAVSARTDVRTVRARGGDEAPGVVLAAAVPSPREIFDFHPAGARPDGWRQPFDIDATDGPLASDLRRSTAELKRFYADREKGAVAAARKPCSETDVATARPGCVATAGRVGTTVLRDPAALH